jgi:DNA-binding transcriptional MerR regulator
MYDKAADFLEPIDISDHLDKIELYLGQVCQIAGISKMQLDYWTNKAQIPTKGKKQRIYDIDALETVMLIKQAKDKGLNLGAAIDDARRFANGPRQALSAAKAAIAAAVTSPGAPGIQAEREAFLSLFGTPDQREGMAAFLEKREPRFGG